MPTQPVDEIFSRRIDNPEIVQRLNDFADLIDETVNFGSHVFSWCTERIPGGDEKAPVFLSFRHLLELMDSISINMRNSSVEPCKLILRGMLESFLSVSYILERDPDKRGMAFMTTFLHDRIRGYKQYDFSTIQGKSLQKKLSEDRIIGNNPFRVDQKMAKLAIENFSKLLKSEKYRESESEYQRLRAKNRKSTRIPWYSFYGGPNTIQQLAEQLRLTSLYHVLYRYWSEAVHGMDIIQGTFTLTDDGKTAYYQIRIPREAHSVTQLTISIALGLYQMFIAKFAPEKISHYQTWYVSEIRRQYLELPNRRILIKGE